MRKLQITERQMAVFLGVATAGLIVVGRTHPAIGCISFVVLVCAWLLIVEPKLDNEMTDEQIKEVFFSNGFPEIAATQIASDCITSAKLASNIQFPDWFKIYTPEEMELKLAQRRYDNVMAQPWIIRTVIITRVRVWSAILRLFNR